jgi:hypothetical protein
MTDVPVQIQSLAELRHYVQEVLCERENLIIDQFMLQESPVVRRGESCGRQFTLYGPRSVRLGAVWDSNRNEIYFYDACGERFRKERLGTEIQAA